MHSMGAITANLFPIICLCFTVVHCDCDEDIKPWVIQKTFVEGGKPFIEFTCEAYLKRGERLTWYKEPKMSLTEIAQRENGWKHIDLLWPLALLSSGDKIHCVKECPSSDTALVGYLSYAQTSSESIPIYFDRTYPPLTNQWGVMVTPDAFEDNGKSLMEFTCWAHLHQGELLSWHQTSDFKTTRLAMIQQGNKYGYVKIELQKTLEPSDKDTQLHCAKETVLPNATLAQAARSQRIPILFERYIEPLKPPYVTVQPSKPNIIFNENDELTFVCDGSEPVDGRNLAWLIKGEDMKLTYPDQSFDKSTKLHLTLRMKPSYHRSQLYCAQVYTINLQLMETDQIIYHYGELAKSHLITLEHRTNEKGTVGGPWLWPSKFEDDGKPVIEFNCWAYLNQGELLTWYQLRDCRSQVSPSTHSHVAPASPCPRSSAKYHQHASPAIDVTHIYSKPISVIEIIQQESYYGYVAVKMRKTLEPSDNGTSLFCVKKSVVPNTWPIEFKWISTTPSIPLTFQRYIEGLADIHVTPGHYIDVHKPFMEFTCFAFSLPGDVLSWYQTKGLNRSVSILRMIQLHNPEHEGEQWMELTLNKTLEQSDNGSEIYCAQQSVLPGGNLSDGSESRRISIAFQRDIKPLEPAFVTVEPNTSIRFDPNTTLRLTCRGSQPVDGRTYMWFRMDSNSKISMPEVQEYDAATTTNVLQLSLNEGYHQNQLYCAQGFLADIRYEKTSRRNMFYGELVTSNKVTLLQRDKEADNDISRLKSSSSPGDTKWTILAIALPVTLAALAAAALLWGARVRRRATRSPPAAPAVPATPDNNTDDDDYVTLSRETAPQVTYAVLDLQSARGAAPAPAPEPVLYAEIAGVYRP